MSDELQVMVPRVPRSITARDIAAVFFRRKRPFAVSFFAVVAAGLFYSAFLPSYQAEMKVMVRRGRIDPAVTPTPSPSPAFEHDEISEEELNSEVELLHDTDILRQVVKENGLSRPTWFSRVTAQNEQQREENAVRRLARKLDVQPVRKSRLITVTYASHDPQRSAAVLCSLGRAYLSKQAELHRPSGQQAFFEEQVNESRRGLERAQADLIAFTKKESIASAELERDLTLQRLSEAEAAESQIESTAAELSQRNRELEGKLRVLPERRMAQVKNSDNPQLQEKLKSKLLELQLKRTELLTKFQPNYRLVEEVDKELAQANEAITSEELRPLRENTTEINPEYEWADSERLKSAVDLAGIMQKSEVVRQQVAGFRAQAQQLSEKAITQHDLEQKLKSAEEKWLLYSNKREEARIGDELDEGRMLNVAIAQEPRAPVIPVWPFWAASCLCVIGACGFSSAIVFVSDYLEPTFRTPDEIAQVLGTPVLASLPARSIPKLRGTEES
jgi:succinoglycan biosynthesis transport protein ExoP